MPWGRRQEVAHQVERACHDHRPVRGSLRRQGPEGRQHGGGILGGRELVGQSGTGLRQRLGAPAAMAGHRHDPGPITRGQQALEQPCPVLVGEYAQDPAPLSRRGSLAAAGPPVEFGPQGLRRRQVVGPIEQQRPSAPPGELLQPPRPAGRREARHDRGFGDRPAPLRECPQHPQRHGAVGALHRPRQAAAVAQPLALPDLLALLPQDLGLAHPAQRGAPLFRRLPQHRLHRGLWGPLTARQPGRSTPAFSAAIRAGSAPSTSAWSMPMLAKPITGRRGCVVVASRRPPRPTSSTASSTPASAKARKAAAVISSKGVSRWRWPSSCRPRRWRRSSAGAIGADPSRIRSHQLTRWGEV